MNSILTVQQNRRGVLKSGAVFATALLVGQSGVRRAVAAPRASIFANGEGAVFVGTNHNNTSDSNEPAN